MSFRSAANDAAVAESQTHGDRRKEADKMVLVLLYVKVSTIRKRGAVQVDGLASREGSRRRRRILGKK